MQDDDIIQLSKLGTSTSYSTYRKQLLNLFK